MTAPFRRALLFAALGVAVGLGGMAAASALQSQLLAIVGIVAGGALVLLRSAYYRR